MTVHHLPAPVLAALEDIKRICELRGRYLAQPRRDKPDADLLEGAELAVGLAAAELRLAKAIADHYVELGVVDAPDLRMVTPQHFEIVDKET